MQQNLRYVRRATEDLREEMCRNESIIPVYMQVKKFNKTATLFSLKNMFQQKLLPSSVMQYKAM